jgi:hypothetical protein
VLAPPCSMRELLWLGSRFSFSNILLLWDPSYSTQRMLSCVMYCWCFVSVMESNNQKEDMPLMLTGSFWEKNNKGIFHSTTPLHPHSSRKTDLHHQRRHLTLHPLTHVTCDINCTYLADKSVIKCNEEIVYSLIKVLLPLASMVRHGTNHSATLLLQ